MISIIDYGMGNLGSIRNMLKKVGAECQVTSDKARIASSQKIILPGVGSFDRGIEHLHERGLFDFLKEQAEQGKPLMGICLGMQLLTNGSDEGSLAGLGLINAYAHRFEAEKHNIKVPHMGWNQVAVCKTTSMTSDLGIEPRFYFVHSYAVRCESDDNILMTTAYGERFASAISKGNVYGFQFHPEKSHKFGMKLFDNFVSLQC